MRDPYLYEDVNVLVNLAGIKDRELLRTAEADITNIAMIGVYCQSFERFNTETLCEIHRMIFGQIYAWAGEFRTIPMIKREEILGGDTVRYALPGEIKKQLNAAMKELSKLRRNGKNDRDRVFRLVRILALVWQIHPFREGNTRAVLAFAVLLGNHFGFVVNHDLFRVHAPYVQNALVWASQGMYSKYEYLERIFFDAFLGEQPEEEVQQAEASTQYEKIGDYNVKDYKPQPHEYRE